ncbi:MAG: hypothetical protein BWY74_02551 [Firmicutes bacterium ADurb.Bin419]|nr:MAG: hypothetical protein BWY74_02551 [Firmicutes bacterium ADurb.Bin419]
MHKITSIIISKFKTLFIVSLGLILLLLSLVNATEIDRVIYKYAVVYVLLLIVSTLVLYRIARKRVFLFGLIVFTLFLRIIWILIAYTEPVSDFMLLNKAANLILEGKLSELKEIQYFNVWVYQLGYSVFCSFLYFIFGNNIFVIKLFNVIFSTGTVVIIYFIAARLFNDKAARISGLLYAVYIQSIIFNSMLTNQVISAFFIYLGLLIIICKSKLGYYFLAGISIAIGHIVRPEGSFALCIIVIAIICNSIFNFIKGEKLSQDDGRNKRANFIAFASKVAVIILTFNVVLQIFGFSLKAFDITEYDFGNRNPYWKFVLGLNKDTVGGYSNEDAKIFDKYPVGEQMYQVEKDMIRERTKNKTELIILICKKFKIMWSNADSSIEFIVPGTGLNQRTAFYLVGLEKVQYTLVLFLSCLSIFFIIKGKNNSMYLYITCLMQL